ncbi:glycosyltransferase [Bacteroidales bacterium OttesenSCG-928-I14]|nr:glycosyltransferase [Bacteroidales bacterium OttesenSCG-928-I14]
MDTNIKSYSPAISVLMPVYNGERYLKEAIESILNQTYEDFELVIINDGSTDNSEQIILSYDDKRIKYCPSIKNEGLIKTLNKGIDFCSGKWIARMDADDISLPERFEKQINFLEQHPEFVMLGAYMGKIDKEGKRKEKYNRFIPNHLLKEQLFFRNYFAHSSMMIRKDILMEFRYDSNYPCAEDYFLWSQIALKYPVANLPEELVLYRVHSESISIQKREQQIATIKKICKYHLSQLKLSPSPEELDLHYKLMWEPERINILSSKTRAKISCWVNRVKEQNERSQVYNREYLSQRLTYRWSRKKQMHILFLNLIQLVKQ